MMGQYRGVTNYLKSRTPALKFCLKYKKSLNLKSYHEKPYKTRSHGKEAKQNQELYESSHIAKSVLQNPAVCKKPYKSRSCGKEAKQNQELYESSQIAKSVLQNPAVYKKLYKSRSCEKEAKQNQELYESK